MDAMPALRYALLFKELLIVRFDAYISAIAVILVLSPHELLSNAESAR